ncbi:hypothetical protein [Kordia sp.]|uniref:hypothetical protein n=1 Tax=Kordia sp. TaxID=1965332 RepID=UPI003B5BA640
MKNNKIVFKRKVPALRFVFGIGFFLVGIIAIFFGNLLGFIFCVVSILFFNRDGSEIKLDTRQYRTFLDTFGFRFGTWENLPEIEYVSVFSTTETTIIQDFTGVTEMTDNIIVLNLFYNGNHRIKAYATTSKEDALKVAKHIAEILKIDILDATEAESKWI